MVLEMEKLSDDEVGQILKRISGRVDRKSCAQVCHQWRRVEGVTRTCLRILDPQLLPSFLPRFKNLLSLEAGQGIADADLIFIAKSCTSLQNLNLNIRRYRNLMDLNFSEDYEYDEIGDVGISAIAVGCKDLRRVALRWRQGISDDGITSLVKGCPYLTHLDLARCKRLTDRALEVIAGASCLEALTLKGCTSVKDQGIAMLSTGKTSLTLKRLDLCECDQITDVGITFLPHMVVLESLNLAECGPRITDVGGVTLSLVQSLQCLNLSWLINVSDVSILAIAQRCVGLRELNISGCELVTGVGIHGFGRHRALQGLTLSACFNIYHDDVERMAMQCSTLVYLGLDRGLRSWISSEALRTIESRCKVEWL